MGPVYRFLGLTVGVIKSGQTADEKRAAYAADITYGTNNEFGFDYLRDNLAFRLEDRVQRGLVFAIVDEVDSILIDEARTPLIISGPAEESTELYLKINQLVPRSKRQEDEEIDGRLLGRREAEAGASLRGGPRAVEKLFARGRHARATARASTTPRTSASCITSTPRCARTAVSSATSTTSCATAKSSSSTSSPAARCPAGAGPTVCTRRSKRRKACASSEENQTVASITFQNYFRMYKKLAGMTGTADTEAFEFQQIYGLEVVVIPTHRRWSARTTPDLVYLTQKDKFDAIVEDIRDCNDARPAGARRHDVDRDVRVPLGPAEEAEDPARGAERETARARGGDRRAGRPARRGHDRDQHGRPRHRHRARRQSRSRAACGSRRRRRRRSRRVDAGLDSSATTKVLDVRRPAHHRHRAARIAAHRQPAARPFGPPGRSGLQPLLPVARRQPDAHLRRSRAHQALAADARA